MKHAAIFLVTLSCTGCIRAPDDAIAAIFELNPKPSSPICLLVDGKDPSAALLVKSRKFNPNVLPGSSCQPSKLGYVVGARNAEVFAIEKLIWRSDPRYRQGFLDHRLHVRKQRLEL
jgi:hypothetical protein